MFSKASRFPKQEVSTPAPGQYDILTSSLKHTGLPSFGSEPRFKHDEPIGDILSESSESLSLKSAVFRTPKASSTRKPYGTDNQRIRELESELQRVQSELNDALHEIARLQIQPSENSSCVVPRDVEIQQQRAKLEYVTQSLQADLEAANERMKNVTARNQQLEEMWNENQNNIDRIEQENLELHKSICELRETCDQMTVEKEERQQAVSMLEKVIAESQQNSEALKDDVERLHQELTERTDELQQLKFDMQQQQDVMQLMTTQYQSQEVELRTLTAQIAVTQSDIDKKQDTIATMGVQLSEAQQRLIREAREAERAIRHLENECSQAASKQVTMESVFMEKLEVAENEKNKLRSDLEDRVTEVVRLKEDVTLLHNQCSHIGATRDKLEAAVKEKDERMQGHVKQIEGLEETVTALLAKLQSVDVQFKESTRRVDELNEELEDARCSKQEQLEIVSTLNKENESLTAELLGTERVIEVYKKQAVDAEREAERVERSKLEEETKAQRIKDELNRLIIDLRTKMANSDQEHEKEVCRFRALLAARDSEVAELQGQLQHFTMVCTMEEKEQLQTEIQTWQTLYLELKERCRPFQEQLEQYEIDRRALMSEKTVAESEMEKLGHDYAHLLGHQNHKQKIHHVQKLKDENFQLKQEVTKLRSQVEKHKQQMKKTRLGSLGVAGRPCSAMKENIQPFGSQEKT